MEPRFTGVSLRDLVLLARGDDAFLAASAFTEFDNQLRKGLHAFCMKLSPSMGEDITQKAFIAAFEKILNCEALNDSSIKAWLYSIALNRYKDEVRRTANAPTVPISDEFDEINHAAILEDAPEHRPESVTLYNACEECVAQSLRSMNQGWAHVFTLRRDGMTFEEIGLALGQPIVTVHRWDENGRQYAGFDLMLHGYREPPKVIRCLGEERLHPLIEALPAKHRGIIMEYHVRTTRLQDILSRVNLEKHLFLPRLREAEDHLANSLVESGYLPDIDCLTEVSRPRAHRALEKLGENDREMLRLSCLGGKTSMESTAHQRHVTIQPVEKEKKGLEAEVTTDSKRLKRAKQEIAWQMLQMEMFIDLQTISTTEVK